MHRRWRWKKAMGNVTERSSNDDGLLADAMTRLQAVEEKAEADIRDARREVFWLLKTRQWQQASHYVEHVCEAEDVRDLTLRMKGYCTLMMQEIRNLHEIGDLPFRLKEAKAGFHFIVTTCKELSCLRGIDQALIMKFGINPLHRYHVDPDISRSLCPRIPRFSEERREKLMKDIAIERGLSGDLGAVGSPEIVESCKICNMTQRSDHEPKTDTPGPSSSLTGNIHDEVD